MQFSPKEKNTLCIAFRQLAYFLLCTALICLITIATRKLGPEVFDENRLIENLQFALLFLSGLVFLVKGLACKKAAPVLMLCSSLAFMGCCREADNVLDAWIPILSWRVGFAFIIAASAYAIMHKADFRAALFDFLRTPSFFMMCFAMIVIGPLAQLIGHKPFLLAALPSYHSVSQIKELFEECTETMGYFLLLLASIEACLSLHRETGNK